MVKREKTLVFQFWIYFVDSYNKLDMLLQICVQFCIKPSFNICIYQFEIFQLESREDFYIIHFMICFSAMSFYFLYFFCIFLRKTTRIKWCRTVFFIFCKYTRIFILFSFNNFFGILSFLESAALTCQHKVERPSRWAD